MQTVQIEPQEDVAVLRLNNGTANAISPLMTEELISTVAGIGRECRAVVLAGNRKFFSMGFDLPGLLSLDRPGMADFFYTFNQVVLQLLTLPCPLVGAVSGHAVAGGHILALACDYRVAGAGRKLGLNEVKLGVPVPYLADLMLRQMTDGSTAKKMLYEGNFVTAEAAERLGLVDEVGPQESIEALAIGKATELGGLPRAAFAAIKSNRVEAIQRRYEAAARHKNDLFLDCWFSGRTQELLAEASRKF